MITDWTGRIVTTCGLPFKYNKDGYGSTTENLHPGPRSGEPMHYGWVTDKNGIKHGNWYYDDGTPARNPGGPRYLLRMDDALKPGDRVRYKDGKTDGRPWIADWAGRTGVVTDRYPVTNKVSIMFDGNSRDNYIHACNLEKIEMTATIDTTKPLVIGCDAVPPINVTFITETSDGHIMTDGPTGWYIFDKQGKFVRSHSGNGVALRLSNKIVEKTLYIALSSFSGDDALRIDDVTQGGSGVAVIAATFREGLLVDARIERANTTPIKKVIRQMPKGCGDKRDLMA